MTVVGSLERQTLCYTFNIYSMVTIIICVAVIWFLVDQAIKFTDNK